MLIFVLGFLYWVLTTILEEEDERFLTSRAHILDVLLQGKAGNPEALEQEITEENVGSASSQYSIYSRILDESGRTLHESPGMEQEIPSIAFPPLGESSTKLKRWHSVNNRNYLLITRQAVDGATGSQRRIQLALDETGENTLVSRYERYLVIVLLIGIFVSAAIGILAARRSMRPLTDIASTAERITSSQLHERIGVTQWPEELVTLAGAFDRMLDRLEDSFNRLSRYSADLAHELRTPINNLRGEAEVALSRPRETDEYRETLISSLEEYGRLSRMVDSLLFLAKADSAQTLIVPSPIDARTEIEKIIVFYEALAAEQGIEVTCEGNGLANVDSDLFQRAIGNLLANALHHTPGGGTIVFSIGSCEERGTTIICHDSGTGIAQEHLPKIFDRFYRVNPSRNTKAEGAGLGLAIVKSIVGLHHGEIEVQSVIGQGTSVRLFFPA